MINVKIIEEDNNKFTYGATITCCFCKETITIKKMKYKQKNGTTGKPRWNFSNFERHLKRKHVDKNLDNGSNVHANIESDKSIEKQPTLHRFVNRKTINPTKESIENGVEKEVHDTLDNSPVASPVIAKKKRKTLSVEDLPESSSDNDLENSGE